MSKNRKTKLALFAFGPQRFGGLEVLLPIVNELTDKGYCSEAQLFFLGRAPTKKQLEQNECFFHIAKALFSRIREGRGLKCYARFMIFVIKGILVGRTPVCLCPEGFNNKLVNVVSRSKVLKVVTYPKVMTRYVRDKAQPLEKNHSIPLSFECNPNPMGFPKFYKSWGSRIQSYFGAEQDCNKAIVVFLPSVVEEVFSMAELQLWIEDVLETLNRHSDIVNLIIKPHPMLKMDELQHIFEKYNQKGFSIDINNDNALGILYGKPTFAISHHSSVILDSLYADIPTIFYQKFTEHWLKRHPEKSHFLDLGAMQVTTFAELAECIEKQSYKKLSPKKTLLKKINHQETLIEIFQKEGVL